MKTNFFITLSAIAFMFNACKNNTSTNLNNSEANAIIMEQYKEVPKDELLANETQATQLYDSLVSKYSSDMKELRDEVGKNNAKFELVFLTPECGNSATLGQKRGKTIIEELATNESISFTDVTANLIDKDPTQITLMPKDGHLSKLGASIVAADLLKVIEKHKGFMAPPNDNLKAKPKTFGDLEVQQDEILDGGKDLPYRLVTNSTGLRMKNEIAYPKKKQRILLFGDSVFFCPFLDNNDGISEQLQALYPEAEIINAANWGYSIDDYLSMYKEKAKFLEADIVVVQTSGNDILDYYFSNRLKFSRNASMVKPTEEEKSFYNSLYSKK